MDQLEETVVEATGHKPTNQVYCMRNAGQISNSLVREASAKYLGILKFSDKVVFLIQVILR